MSGPLTSIEILNGVTTQVLRSSGVLVALEGLSGSGPQGPAGPQGPQGKPRVVDTSLFYTKLEVDGALAFKQSLLQVSPSTGSKVWDAALQQVRNVVGVDGIQCFIYMNPTNPSDPQNNALIVSGAALQGGGIPTTIAQVLETGIYLKKRYVCSNKLAGELRAY